jgi:nucleotide-binding universal stress UspA family protein
MKHAPFAESNDRDLADNKSFRIKTILAPIDFSEHSMFAFRYATHLAEKIGGKVIVLNVVENPLVYPSYGPGEQEKVAAKAQQRLYKACQSDAVNPDDVETLVRLAVEPVPEEIVLAARDVAADLIVVPAHHRTIFGHALFSTTVDKVERHAPCPVLVVPVPPHATEKLEDFNHE